MTENSPHTSPVVDPSLTAGNNLGNPPTPERLPEEEVGKLISAIGNHENKALVCAAMLPGKVYSSAELRQLYIDMQGDEPVWIPGGSTVFGYCVESLAPIGLVAKEIIDPDKGTSGFVKTATGTEIGEALSGHLLDFSLRYPLFSLQKLFGKTGTTSKTGARAPTARVEIFEELLKSEGSIRVSDVGGDVFKNSRHIQKMADEGIVTLRFWQPTESLTQYELGKVPINEVRFRKDTSDLTYDVRDVLVEHLASGEQQGPTIPEIISHLQSRDARYGEMDHGTLSRKINRALSRFVACGAVARTGDFNPHNRSMIVLSTEQRTVLEDLLSIIHRLQAPDEAFIREGKQKAHSILTQPEAVRLLVAKARANSTNANSRPRSKTAQLLFKVLQEHPGLTIRELEPYISGSLTRRSIGVILKEMEANGASRREPRNKKIAWFVIEKAS